jgi:peptidoglycan pentaglycine glycine transferase (the first glycine)
MLEVKPLTEKKIWQNFIASTYANTFLQSWQWADFNDRIKASTNRLGVYQAGKLVAAALVLTVRARRGTFLLIPHGPIVKNESELSEILGTLTAELKKIAVRSNASFIRIAPLVKQTPEHESVFTKLGFRNAPVHMVHPELAWILDITPEQEMLLKNMRKSTRYSIKKAEKDGVTISTSTDVADVEKFWRVYSQTVKRQHFTAFTKDFLRAEFETFSKDNRAAFFFAEFKGDTTATAFIIFDEYAGYYHHGATTQKYSGLTDAQLLQWAVIKECKKRGLKKYNFWGVVPENLNGHPWSGLSTFKRGFGGYEEQYLHAKDLRLSPKYWITYAIEKVRRWKRHL